MATFFRELQESSCIDFFFLSILVKKYVEKTQLCSLLTTNDIHSLPHPAAGKIQPLSSPLQVAPGRSSVFNTSLSSFIHSSCPVCTSSSDNLKKGGPQACDYYNPLSVYSRDGEKTFASARQEIPDVVVRTDW